MPALRFYLSVSHLCLARIIGQHLGDILLSHLPRCPLYSLDLYLRLNPQIFLFPQMLFLKRRARTCPGQNDFGLPFNLFPTFSSFMCLFGNQYANVCRYLYKCFQLIWFLKKKEPKKRRIFVGFQLNYYIYVFANDCYFVFIEEVHLLWC